MHSNEEGLGGVTGGSRESERPSSEATETAGLESVSALSDADLLTRTRRLMCQSNRVLAALLAHLAEVDARGLHRTRACSNLYTYCIYELRMPEDTSDEVPFSDELPQSGALTESPRRRGRHVPAAVRRAVCERDGHRCAYIDARGVRCRETSRLELHHREPFARGGPSTAENLSLHCAAHNALAAEQDFGHASAIARRDYPHFTERTLLCEAQRE